MPSTRIILKPLGVLLIVMAFGVVATLALLKNRSAGSVTPVAIAAPVSVAPTAVAASLSRHLRNGDMESGAGIPTGWDSRWVETGRLNIVRDTAKRNSGSASLRLESVGDASVYASTSQDLTALSPGQTIRVSVAGCAEGKLDEAFIVLQVFDPTFKRQLGFDAIAAKEHLTAGGGFSTQIRTITLPNEPFIARIAVLMKGKGKVWADDISVTATK